ARRTCCRTVSPEAAPSRTTRTTVPLLSPHRDHPPGVHVSIVSPVVSDVRHIAAPSPRRSFETLVFVSFETVLTEPTPRPAGWIASVSKRLLTQMAGPPSSANSNENPPRRLRS